MSELGLVFLLVQSVLGVVLAIRYVQLKKKYYFLEVDYMIARDKLAPFQKMLKRMDTKEYRLKAGFEEFKFMRLYQVLKEYQLYLQSQIDIARKELGDGEDSEVERLQGIKADVEVCLKALVDNGSWKE